MLTCFREFCIINLVLIIEDYGAETWAEAFPRWDVISTSGDDGNHPRPTIITILHIKNMSILLFNHALTNKGEEDAMKKNFNKKQIIILITQLSHQQSWCRRLNLQAK